MITFHIVTIFPEIFDSYLNESILKRAQKKKLIGIQSHDIRDFTADKHRTTDDKPYGGGVGMVMKIEPIYKALKTIPKTKKTRVILLSPKGKRFTQADAARLASKYNQLVFTCGRYEGFDDRISKLADERISIGDYVITGGELAVAVIIDAVTRLLPGVLGKDESSREESHSQSGVLEYPQYTRPEIFFAEGESAPGGQPDKKTKWRVPKALLSGDHKKIREWREGHKIRV